MSFTSYGQYNNSWIDYTQNYYKIPVAQSGVYRIDYNNLQSVGFPTGSVDPRWISIYHRGIEQEIIVTGQQDANFDVGDYIEFYGTKNDGTIDKQMYITPEAQPHNYYNLYSDTTSYFLTWTTGVNGKRMTTYKSNNIDGLIAENYQKEQRLLINTEEYATGKSYGDYIQLTNFDIGEGWSGIRKQEGQSIDYTLSNITNTLIGVDKPSLEIQLVGRDDKQHQIKIQVGADASSLRTIGTANFNLYDTYVFTSQIEWSDISVSGEMIVRFNIQGVNGANDLASINYIKLNFPQQWDMLGVENKWFNTKENILGRSYVEITNTPSLVKILDITKAESPVIIEHNNVTDGINAMIDNTDNQKQLYAYSSAILPVLKPISFTNLSLSQYDYVIISHSTLMKSGGAYANPVQAYADYRNSAQGGSYNTLVLDIDEVFNQFSFGEYSPVAIRNLLERWVGEGSPKGLFLIGKALLVGWKTGSDYYRNNPDVFTYKDLVPTAGRPGSDLHYGMGLKGDPNELVVPVGRLTANTPDQVAGYLDKIKEKEAASIDDLWRKEILHLSGGLSSTELTRFADHVNSFKSIAESLYLGGRVTSIRKQSSNTVEFINTTDLINDGLNLITFFGHSAPNITDIDIGYVSDPVHGYSNKGKYPMILVNGCNAGQVFGNYYLWGEDWTLTPELGSIGLIAHTHYGYESALRDYSNTFYKKAFGDSSLIYQPIGRIFQEVIKQYRTDFGTNVLDVTQTEQMVLIGDPLLRLFNAKSPDYKITDNDVFLEPYVNGNIDALVDSFAIGAIIKNLGRADQDSIRMRVERLLDDNTTIYYDTIFPSVYYQDTLKISIYNDNLDYAGRNRFKILVDYLNDIEELNELNNTANLEINLTLNGTKNLIPHQYAIVNNRQVNLKLQSSNVVGQEARDYVIELDTIYTFNSAFKQQQIVNANVLAQVAVNLLAQDSLVYYWRSKFATPQSGENEGWSVNSFTYLKNGNKGWMQSHRQQIVDDEFHNLIQDVATGKLSFTEVENSFDLKVYGANHPTENYTTLQFDIDGLPYVYPSRLCRDNSINLVAFSKETAKPYAGLPSSYWSFETCGRQDQVVNNFKFSRIANSGGVSLDNTDNLLEQYLDSIPEGDYVLIFTTGDIGFNNWSPEMAAQLEKVGGSAATIASLGAGEPYILFGKKGAISGTSLEIIAAQTPLNEQTLSLSKVIKGTAKNGFIESTLIGPSATWETFNNLVGLSEAGNIDYTFDIYGIDNNGVSTLRYENIINNTLDISQLDPIQNPYIKIKMNFSDDIYLTVSQLKFWQVEYTGVPEGVLLLGENGEGYALERQEGDGFSTAFKFINVSENSFPTDLLDVDQKDNNLGTRGVYLQNLKINAPAPGDTTHFNIESTTRSKLGLNDYHVFVNDYVHKEQFYDNNSILLPEYFHVFKDVSNPLLQVMFNGRHITNGEIVSANPLIETVLWDENPYLFSDDTIAVSLYLKRPCEGCTFERINFSSDQVLWSFDNEDNKMTIEYRPERLEDGVYSFRVQAEDVSGNKSGDEPYEVQFEVINKSSITNFYIYPNPIFDKARFAFRLTGSQVPEHMQVQIMNLNGKTVRVITEKDFGNLRIGENVSVFEWDGTNQSGNELPSGLYIYRLSVVLNGVELVNKETSSDKGFTNGVGKIYLIR